jgi:hypothetical protein
MKNFTQNLLQTVLIFILLLTLQFCNGQEKFPAKALTTKVKVLNLGTFHMGTTSDANSTNYDEHDQKNILENREIAKKIAEFKPTIILVEYEPKHNDLINNNYQKYKNNPNIKFESPSEVELLAFEIGRLSGVKKIYGIDHQMGYNYMKIDGMANKVNAETYLKFMSKDEFPDDPKMNTLELLIYNNQPKYLDYLININADMMTYVSTQGNFEGAEEAAQFYKRNLIMFSNINRIPLNENDRVFILSGSTHAAFFNEFMKRSPRYELVNVFEYLK